MIKWTTGQNRYNMMIIMWWFITGFVWGFVIAALIMWLIESVKQ